MNGRVVASKRLLAFTGLTVVAIWLGTQDGPNWELNAATRVLDIALWLLPFGVFYKYVRTFTGSIVIGVGLIGGAITWLLVIFQSEHSTVGLLFFYGPFTSFILVGFAAQIDAWASKRSKSPPQTD